MKLLFDQNLSHRLADKLQDAYPGSEHSRNVLSAKASEDRIWEYAKEHDFIVVSKDSNFSDLSQDRGQPPKAVRLTLGNCTVDQVEQLLRQNYDDICKFNKDERRALLQLSRPQESRRI